MSWPDALWARVQEIEDFAAEEGITLPLPAEQIARIEDEGSIVDLSTGEIFDEEPETETAPAKSWWQR